MYETFDLIPSQTLSTTTFNVDLSSSDTFRISLTCPHRQRILQGTIIVDRSFPTTNDVTVFQQYTFSVGANVVVGSMPTLNYQIENRTGTLVTSVSILNGSIQATFSLNRANNTITSTIFNQTGMQIDFPLLMIIQAI